MDKKLIIAISAIFFVALVMAFIFLEKKDQKPASPQSAAGDQISGTMKEIFDLGKNLKCEALAADGQKIILYIYGKKIKVIMPMPDSDKDFIYSIYDGEYVYGWQNEQKEGTKFKVDPKQYFEPQPQEAVQEDFSKTLDYKCSAWVVDSHEFDLPSDISFQDMTSIVEEAQRANEAALEKMCKNCSSMQGEEKASCEIQFCTQE
jgi:hypothetical protein